MDIEEIEVTVGKDGRVEMRVRGVKGEKCLEITAELEKTLGGIVLSREMSPEASEEPNSISQPDNQNTIQQSGG